MTPPMEFGRVLYVHIKKSGLNIQVMQELSDDESGLIEIDLTALPAGFFNQYGGQYVISFSDDDIPNNLIQFVAKDGKTYDSICIGFMLTFANFENNVVVVNAISDEQP
jgi:hypothetical protein